jgi:pimeloyl-ACP methyl ester carboxylesterase
MLCRAVVVYMLAAALAVGCSSNKIAFRSTPNNPLVDQLELASYSGPKPTSRTRQFLRVHNLGESVGDVRPLLVKLQAISDRHPTAEVASAMSELAYLGGKKIERYDKRAALELYGASALHAFDYLFDPRFAATRNPYDPQYRGVCDLYNGALEAALRLALAKKELKPGSIKTLDTTSGRWRVACVLGGPTPRRQGVAPCGFDDGFQGNAVAWRPEDFERFEFVSDYEVTGLKNMYVSHGLGVPLIAVRHSPKDGPAVERYYPPGLSFPVTAFLRPLRRVNGQSPELGGENQCLLELYDTLNSNETLVGDRVTPLESDLTTPLAYFLSKPQLESLATIGLLRPEKLLAYRPDRPDPIMGLYMAQPYEADKIPVIMVHGLWSSPMTWMEMFNDLRSQPEIRRRYQFWFYLYPTGQPFWLSAAQLRHDLERLRETVDPARQSPALDRMVLIGHSMGGLLARLQTVSGGDDYWRLVSRKPLDEIKTDDATRRKLAQIFYFQPNPSISRVISLGTPYRGSKFSNQTTQWLLSKLIHLPQKFINGQQKLFRDNPQAFAADSLLRIDTSVDSLSPKTPIFPVLLASRHPWATYHNIAGLADQPWWLEKLVGEGDGVVARSSAHLDDAVSEITVPADHSTVHAHPAAVLEVRRILLEHLAEIDGRRPNEELAGRTVP